MPEFSFIIIIIIIITIIIIIIIIITFILSSAYVASKFSHRQPMFILTIVCFMWKISEFESKI